MAIKKTSGKAAAEEKIAVKATDIKVDRAKSFDNSISFDGAKCAVWNLVSNSFIATKLPSMFSFIRISFLT